MQFFGFKNPFVQRLLRELAANVNGIAERNLCSSINLGSKEDNDSHCPDTCRYPNLLPYLQTVKRSRRQEIINDKSVSGENLKKPRPQDPTCVAKASNSIKNLRNHTIAKSSLSSLKKDSGISVHPTSLPMSGNLIPLQEKKSHVSEDGLQLKSFDMSNHLRDVTTSAQEARMHVGSENCKSTRASSRSPMEEKPVSTFPLLSFSLPKVNFSMLVQKNLSFVVGKLMCHCSVVNLFSMRKILDFSQPNNFRDTEVQELAFPIVLEIKNGDTTSSKDCQGMILIFIHLIT